MNNFIDSFATLSRAGGKMHVDPMQFMSRAKLLISVEVPDAAFGS